MTVYLIDFLQHQQTDLFTLVFDVYMTELMSVCDDRADFSNSVLVAHSEIVDALCEKLLEHMVQVDVHHLAVLKKCC